MSESPPQSDSSRDCHSEKKIYIFYVSIQNKAIYFYIINNAISLRCISHNSLLKYYCDALLEKQVAV